MHRKPKKNNKIILFTFKTNFVSDVLEGADSASGPKMLYKLNKFVGDLIEGRKKSEDCAGSHELWRKSFAQFVPCLSLPVVIKKCVRDIKVGTIIP